MAREPPILPWRKRKEEEAAAGSAKTLSGIFRLVLGPYVVMVGDLWPILVTALAIIGATSSFTYFDLIGFNPITIVGISDYILFASFSLIGIVVVTALNSIVMIVVVYVVRGVELVRSHLRIGFYVFIAICIGISIPLGILYAIFLESFSNSLCAIDLAFCHAIHQSRLYVEPIGMDFGIDDAFMLIVALSLTTSGPLWFPNLHVFARILIAILLTIQLVVAGQISTTAIMYRIHSGFYQITATDGRVICDRSNLHWYNDRVIVFSCQPGRVESIHNPENIVVKRLVGAEN